jgi:hypothetical protein
VSASASDLSLLLSLRVSMGPETNQESIHDEERALLSPLLDLAVRYNFDKFELLRHIFQY